MEGSALPNGIARRRRTRGRGYVADIFGIAEQLSATATAWLRNAGLRDFAGYLLIKARDEGCFEQRMRDEFARKTE